METERSMGTEIRQQEIQRYASMQKAFYDDMPHQTEEIVGNYDFHQNFPYETHLLHLYGDLRKPVLADAQRARGFDIGCGEGRMIRRIAPLLARCDGADISQKMVDAARRRTPGSEIFLSSGTDCGAAPSNAYDFGFCTISLHHICVHETRSLILQDLVRILRPDGCATLQFMFSRYYPFCRTVPPPVNDAYLVDIHHRDRLQAGWFDNRWDAAGTNSMCDAAFGSADLPAVRDDFGHRFEQVDVWFHDLSIGRPDHRADGRERLLPEIHPNCHGSDDAWFTHMAFFHLRGPRK